jgi:hypothetical protein
MKANYKGKLRIKSGDCDFRCALTQTRHCEPRSDEDSMGVDSSQV